MKRNLTVNILDLSGAEVLEPDGAGGVRPIPARVVARNALLARRPNEDLKLEDQMTRYNLAKRIEATPDDVELSAEEIALIKRLVAQNYAPLVTGFVSSLLEAD